MFLSLCLTRRQMQMQQAGSDGSSLPNARAAFAQITTAAHQGCLNSHGQQMPLDYINGEVCLKRLYINVDYSHPKSKESMYEMPKITNNKTYVLFVESETIGTDTIKGLIIT